MRLCASSILIIIGENCMGTVMKINWAQNYSVGTITTTTTTTIQIKYSID